MATRSTHVTRTRCIGAATLLACVFAYSSVRAQLLETYFPSGVPGHATAPGVTVLSRVRPEYDNLGTRLDSFILRPRLDTGVGYDTNVVGGAASRGSLMVVTRPSLLVNSDWSSNALSGYVAMNDIRYLDQPQQSRTDWSTSLGGTLAVGRDQLTLGMTHLSLHQDRTELDALPSDQPVAYRVDNAHAAYTIALNRVAIIPSLDFTAYRYSATTILGASAPQSYRDRNLLQGAVTTRYELAPQRNLVVVVRALSSQYLVPQPGQPTRDSTGYELLAGLDGRADAVWCYRLLVGWEIRDFAASSYPTHQAPIVEAELIWSPSGLTTVTGTVTRSIEDAAQEGIAGYTYTRAKLTLDHELQRDLLLQLSASMQQADFLQGGGTVNGVSVGAGATWLMNRHMRLSATYDFTDLRGNPSPTLLTTGSYTRGIALLTLRLGL